MSNVLNVDSPHFPTLLTLMELARAYKLEVWQLLSPDCARYAGLPAERRQDAA